MSIYSIAQAGRWYLMGYPASQYRKILQESENWQRDRLEEFRDDKLRRLITHCYENVPYYRRVMQERKLVPADIRRAADLAKLPILTKDLLRKFYDDLMASNVGSMRTVWAKTGGTTGEPIRVCRNIQCVAWTSMCYERGLRWGGLVSGKPRVKLFGGSLGMGHDRPVQRIGAWLRGELFLPAFELRVENAKKYFDAIKQSKSRFIIGYASAIYRLAELARQINESVEFTAVFPTAELMLPGWEQSIRKTFNCEVLPYYGCGEVHSLGFSNPSVGGYSIPEEHALIEIMQRDGSILLDGEGRFLLTDLDNYAMPIIRYLNGDAGKISLHSEKHPWRSIERLDGRFNNLLMTDSGDLISGVIGTHVFRHTVSVKRYQIIQEEPLRVVIKVVPEVEITEDDKELIIRLFSQHLGSRMKITIQIISDLPVPPSGKSVFVINHCLNAGAYPISITDSLEQGEAPNR